MFSYLAQKLTIRILSPLCRWPANAWILLKRSIASTIIWNWSIWFDGIAQILNFCTRIFVWLIIHLMHQLAICQTCYSSQWISLSKMIAFYVSNNGVRMSANWILFVCDYHVQFRRVCIVYDGWYRWYYARCKSADIPFQILVGYFWWLCWETDENFPSLEQCQLILDTNEHECDAEPTWNVNAPYQPAYFKNFRSFSLFAFNKTDRIFENMNMCNAKLEELSFISNRQKLCQLSIEDGDMNALKGLKVMQMKMNMFKYFDSNSLYF